MSRLTVDRWFTRGQLPTGVEDGTVVADLRVPGVDVPADVLVVPVDLEASLRRVVPVAGGWELTVFASARWVDLAAHAPTVTARAVHASGHGVGLPVTPAPDPAATRHVADCRHRACNLRDKATAGHKIPLVVRMASS